MSKLVKNLVCANCGNNNPAEVSHDTRSNNETVICEHVLPDGSICKNIIKHGNKEDIARIDRAKLSYTP